MAERDKKITELDNGGFVADGLFIADDIDQNDSLITQSHLISEIGEKTMDDFQYATAGFNTTDKTPVGAINEIQPSLTHLKLVIQVLHLQIVLLQLIVLMTIMAYIQQV